MARKKQENERTYEMFPKCGTFNSNYPTSYNLVLGWSDADKKDKTAGYLPSITIIE